MSAGTAISVENLFLKLVDKCIVHSNNQTDRMAKNINFLVFRPRKESNARNRNQVLVFRAFLEKFYDFIKDTGFISP